MLFVKLTNAKQKQEMEFELKRSMIQFISILVPVHLSRNDFFLGMRLDSVLQK